MLPVKILGEAFGNVGSDEADELCIKQLLPNRLQDQFCFRTQKALDSLEFIRGEKVCLKR